MRQGVLRRSPKYAHYLNLSLSPATRHMRSMLYRFSTTLPGKNNKRRKYMNTPGNQLKKSRMPTSGQKSCLTYPDRAWIQFNRLVCSLHTYGLIKTEVMREP